MLLQLVPVSAPAAPHALSVNHPGRVSAVTVVESELSYKKE